MSANARADLDEAQTSGASAVEVAAKRDASDKATHGAFFGGETPGKP